MKAFHGLQSTKDKYLNRVVAHRKADQIIKGVYWENGKGCAVGCTVHSNQHSTYETELGIPRILARLEDGLFEALPNDLAKTWPERFLSAIRPGADLSHVWPKFAIWLMINKKHGVIKHAKTKEQGRIIFRIVNLYKLGLTGAVVPNTDWVEVRKAAYAAAYAADAADAAAYAADAAAYAAAYAAYAAYAADAAAYAYAADTADAAAAYAADAAAYAAAAAVYAVYAAVYADAAAVYAAQKSYWTKLINEL